MQQGRERGASLRPSTNLFNDAVSLYRLANLEASFKLFVGNLPPDPTVEMLQVAKSQNNAQPDQFNSLTSAQPVSECCRLCLQGVMRRNLFPSRTNRACPTSRAAHS
jgi:hypothetical protein